MIECIDCGARVERTGRNQKRCADCRVVATKEAVKRASAEWVSRNRERSRQIRRKSYAKNGPRPVTDREAHRRSATRWKVENPGAVARATSKQKEKFRSIGAMASRSGLRYTPAEDAAILAWNKGLVELAASLGRGVDSVTIRRATLLRGESSTLPLNGSCEICGATYLVLVASKKFCGRKCSLKAKSARQKRYELRKRGELTTSNKEN